MAHTLCLDEEEGIRLSLDVFISCPLLHKCLAIARIPKGDHALILALIGKHLAIGVPVHGGPYIIDAVFHRDLVAGF